MDEIKSNLKHIGRQLAKMAYEDESYKMLNTILMAQKEILNYYEEAGMDSLEVVKKLIEYPTITEYVLIINEIVDQED